MGTWKITSVKLMELKVTSSPRLVVALELATDAPTRSGAAVSSDTMQLMSQIAKGSPNSKTGSEMEKTRMYGSTFNRYKSKLIRVIE
nr:hypothetical protein CFP56_13832 [Quercus suber]